MLLEQLVDKGSNHLLSLFANKLTFYLIKVSSYLTHELTFTK